ncbi:MAG: ABC transporter substrate-binding protein [Bacteroidetes bacterium]|jgi:chorismate dehydratase|nr:ABC transporter substrate-binding protein [Bacteroidota bacterium]
MEKLNVTAVSYLNTKPLLYGLLNSPIANDIRLELNVPSVCAQKLRDGEADLALVPVAIIPEIDRPRIVSDYCIGTVGAVKTVCLYSNCPIEEAKAIYLDHHSRTSVALTKLLLRDYWKTAPKLVPAQEGYIKQIGGRVAGLVIGDRTIGLEKQFRYTYDLGEVWMKHTGLPFVFAAWVSNRPIPGRFQEAFNEAMRQGVAQIPQLMYLLPSPDPAFDLEAYFTRYISYELDEAKRQAMELFLEKMEHLRVKRLGKL